VTPNLNLFDVERVEVLRGPQGTLYGSGSMGGTLRVIFKRPDFDTYEGSTEFGGEAIQNGQMGYSLKGAVNVPVLKDVLAARLVLYRQQNGGYVNDPVIGKTDLNRSVLQGLRFQLGFRPTSNLSMNFMTIVQTQNFDGTSQWAPSIGKFVSEQKIASPAYDKLQLYALETKWETPIGTLALNNSFYRWDVRQTNDNSDNYASIIASNRYCGLFQNTYGGSLLQSTSAGASTSSSTCATGAGGLTPAQLRANYQSWGAAQQPIGNYQPRFVRNYVNELRLSSSGKSRFNYTLGVFREDRDDRVNTLVFAGVPATGDAAAGGRPRLALCHRCGQADRRLWRGQLSPARTADPDRGLALLQLQQDRGRRKPRLQLLQRPGPRQLWRSHRQCQRADPEVQRRLQGHPRHHVLRHRQPGLPPRRRQPYPRHSRLGPDVCRRLAVEL
jgi:outer membrane receptor protein involved in Fe transport